MQTDNKTLQRKKTRNIFNMKRINAPYYINSEIQYRINYYNKKRYVRKLRANIIHKEFDRRC